MCEYKLEPLEPLVTNRVDLLLTVLIGQILAMTQRHYLNMFLNSSIEIVIVLCCIPIVHQNCSLKIIT